MSLTVSWASGGKSGDGQGSVTQVLFNAAIPTAGGAAMGLQGTIQGVTQTLNGVTSFVVGVANVQQGAALTALALQQLSLPSPNVPVVPGSGTTYWNVQCDPYTGVCTIYTSSTADPVPQPCAGANSGVNQVVLGRQALVAGTTDVSTLLFDTPDMW